MLKERDELEGLMTDLLFSMNIKPRERPKKGVRQYGVDISAVGIDPKDKKEKLFILVLKMGNITRSVWDGNPQAIRPSLNEIFDVYINSHINKKDSNLPKKIILCSNGELAQEVSANWNGYKDDKNSDNVELDLWDADEITYLVEGNLLNEYLFPEYARKAIRKTLVMLDDPNYDMRHFYDFVLKILHQKGRKNQKDWVKILRMLNLCLSLIYVWGRDEDYLKSSLLASERLLLYVWDWMKKKNFFDKKKICEEVGKIEINRRIIFFEYFEKIKKSCFYPDGLFVCGVNKIEYPLMVFENIGIISCLGLSFVLDWMAADNKTGKEQSEKDVLIVAVSLAALINNNKVSFFPLFDWHVNDISLALILFYRVGRRDVAIDWLCAIFQSIRYANGLLKRRPLFSNSYEELSEVEAGKREVEMKSSTLLPILLEWIAIFDAEEVYKQVREMYYEFFKEVNLQIWYPDEQLEDFMYQEDASNFSGSTRHSIVLPEKFSDFKQQILKDMEQEVDIKSFSFYKYNFLILSFISSRHFRTPIPPRLWRCFIGDSGSNKNEENLNT